MEEEKKENIPEHHHKKSSLTEKIRENPWSVSTFILGILVVILLVAVFSGSLTGNAVSKEKAASNLLSYLKTVADPTISLVDVKNSGDLYLATISYKGQDVPVYLTKDGAYYTTTLVPITNNPSNTNTNTNTQPKNVPKSDKPSVELYVFTYCPYGLQMEKAMLPVINLLGNKIDFRIRQIGAMHGDFEKTEAQRQLCIEKNYPDKYLNYVSAFAEDTSCPQGASTCVDTKVNAIYSKLGIDANTINTCMPTDGLNLYNTEVQNAQSKGVSGSPTLIINGVDVQSGRSPEEIKGAICNAFNNVPSECSQALSTSQASAGFGSGASSGSTSGVQCATA